MTKLIRYKTYSFTRQDPVIKNVILPMVQRSNQSYGQISRESGVSRSTMKHWETGKTRCPKFATIMAVARSVGYDMKFYRKKEGE